MCTRKHTRVYTFLYMYTETPLVPGPRRSLGYVHFTGVLVSYKVDVTFTSVRVGQQGGTPLTPFPVRSSPGVWDRSYHTRSEVDKGRENWKEWRREDCRRRLLCLVPSVLTSETSGDGPKSRTEYWIRLDWSEEGTLKRGVTGLFLPQNEMTGLDLTLPY